jgi:nucleoside-diphosphate-sugar epimerase
VEVTTKRALVTGSAGFIGRHMTAELERRGYDVIGVDIANEIGSIMPGRDDVRMAHTWPTDLVFDLVVHAAGDVGPTNLANPEHVWSFETADVDSMLRDAGWLPLISTVIDFRPANVEACYQIWLAE